MSPATPTDPGSLTGSETAAPELFSVVSSHQIYHGAVVTLRVDDVVMPDGGTAKREVVEHARAVAVVAVDTNGGDPSVLLIEQYRHPLGRRLWELPAGLMDVDGEPEQVAAARELFEETGFAAASWSVLVDVATSPGFTDETVRIFLATDLTAHERPEAVHEEAELRMVQVPLSTAVDAVLAGKIVNVMAVAGILAANTVLGPDADRWDRIDVPTEAETDEPWMTHRGSGIPDAPPLNGSTPR